MGVYPYITASIVVQLLQGIIPKLGAMSREGESGRNRLAQITRYITVPLALLQAFGQMALLVQLGAIQPTQFNLFNGGSFVPTLSALVSLTAGTMFLVWIGELITENGIGNGISLIIFANIMVRIPQQIGSQLISNSGGTGSGLSTGGAISILFISRAGAGDDLRDGDGLPGAAAYPGAVSLEAARLLDGALGRKRRPTSPCRSTARV